MNATIETLCSSGWEESIAERWSEFESGLAQSSRPVTSQGRIDLLANCSERDCLGNRIEERVQICQELTEPRGWDWRWGRSWKGPGLKVGADAEGDMRLLDSKSIDSVRLRDQLCSSVAGLDIEGNCCWR